MSFDTTVGHWMDEEAKKREMELEKQEKAYDSAREELKKQKTNLQTNYQALINRKHNNDLLQTVASDYAAYYEKIKRKMELVNERMAIINKHLEGIIKKNQITDYRLGDVLEDTSRFNEKIRHYRAQINGLL